MIQTALIAIFLIFVVTFLSSPNKESHPSTESTQSHASAEEKHSLMAKQTEAEPVKIMPVQVAQVVEVEIQERVAPKVNVIIPGIPHTVALPQVETVIEFEDTTQADLLENETALKEQALAMNQKLQEDLAQKQQKEEELKALLAKLAKMAELGEAQANAYEASTKQKIADLEKTLLENVHQDQDLQSKIENFPTKINGLVDAIEEISQKAENEL